MLERTNNHGGGGLLAECGFPTVV